RWRREERKYIVTGGLIAVRTIVEKLLGSTAAKAGQVAGNCETAAGGRGRRRHRDGEQEIAGRINRRWGSGAHAGRQGGIATADVCGSAAVARNGSDDDEVIRIVVGVDAAVAFANARSGVAERGDGSGFETAGGSHAAVSKHVGDPAAGGA